MIICIVCGISLILRGFCGSLCCNDVACGVHFLRPCPAWHPTFTPQSQHDFEKIIFRRKQLRPLVDSRGYRTYPSLSRLVGELCSLRINRVPSGMLFQFPAFERKTATTVLCIIRRGSLRRDEERAFIYFAPVNCLFQIQSSRERGDSIQHVQSAHHSPQSFQKRRSPLSRR